MKLYSGPLSLFTAKVRIALAEKAIPYERIEVGWSPADRYEPHHPDVVALNPKRQVPVLVDGDVVVYDSTVILEYLEDRHPDPALLPADPADRARCRQWEAWADETLFASVWELIEEAFYPPGPGGRDPARLAAAQAGLADCHAELDKQLASREYVAGDFSIADLGAAVFLGAAATMGAPPSPDRTHLLAWLQRCMTRPAIQTEMSEMTTFSQQAFR